MTSRDNRLHSRNEDKVIRSLRAENRRLLDQKKQDDHTIEELKQHMSKLEEENKKQAELDHKSSAIRNLLAGKDEEIEALKESEK